MKINQTNQETGNFKRIIFSIIFTSLFLPLSNFAQKISLKHCQETTDTTFLETVTICEGTKISFLDHPILESGLYCKTFKNKRFCDSTSCVQVNILPKPDLKLIGPPGNISRGEEVYFSLFSELNNIEEIYWFQEDSMISSSLPEIYVYPKDSENYKVKIKDIHGCLNEAQSRIIVKKERKIFIPNVFSPNSDGINDFFTLFTEEDALTIQSLRIFDQWGDMVFERLNFEPNITSLGWDGTYKRMKSTSNVFAFYAEVLWADGLEEVIKGEITIAR